MREQHAAQFCGIDIGTSTVRCVIGAIEAGDSGQISIIGHGSATNIGMRKGVVVHVDDVAEAITKAVGDAERLAGVKVTKATVNINGSHIGGVNSRGVIAISSANREITQEDRMRVEEAAAILQLPANREIIQVFAKNYRLDGQDNIKDPVGMHGVRLEVDTHIVSASTPSLKSLDSALEAAHIVPAHHSVSSLAAAEAVLNRQQKESGTLLLDIGAGTTNVVILEDGEVQHVAVIPIGGLHITNDLAIGLRTDLDIAEKVKIAHGGLGQSASKRLSASVEHDKQHHNFSTDDIRMIIEARVDELLEYVDKELKKIQRHRRLPGGVVLVGGSSKLVGLSEFVKDKLQLAARLGRLQSVGGLVEAAQDLSYSSVVGLMLLDMLFEPSLGSNYVSQSAKGVVSIIQSIFGKRK